MSYKRLRCKADNSWIKNTKRELKCLRCGAESAWLEPASDDRPAKLPVDPIAKS